MQKIIRMLIEHCTALHYKGNKANTSSLPATANVGDIYNIGSSIEGDDYYWNGKEWEKLNSTLDLTPYATKASPTFTGTPKAPTASAGTNTTQIATTAFVQAAITSAVAELVSTYGLTVPTSNTSTPE